MEKLKRFYIKERIKTTRTTDSDIMTSRLSHPGKSHAELARCEARQGFPETTASYLNKDTSLSDYQRGEILAEAYNRHAERKAYLAEHFKASEILVAVYRRDERRFKRIAQGLIRAARRVQTA
jgi:hypothetical protein